MKAKIAARFSVSLPPDLFRELERMAKQKGYDNRSLAIADMIRDQLVEHRTQQRRGEIAGTITLVYDHHTRRVQELLTSLQHDHPDLIIATMHVHLDHDNCLEVLVARGDASAVKRMADQLIGARGVKHGRLTVTSTGRDLPA
ncbi:MAG: nickel-responsive transcriptional regulator NikR [Chthoniobacterales bacterium]|nr:nickel-responsive transcriptional regulator NikR [Chthoniobacterales bacterium]